jgi:hypothetical protein
MGGQYVTVLVAPTFVGQHRGMRLLAALTLVVVLLVGCGGDGGRICSRSSDDAELCLVRKAGSYEIEGQGLKPGSEIVTEVGGKAMGQPQVVGDDGRPQGVVGLLGRGFHDVTVDAVVANGERLHLTMADG